MTPPQASCPPPHTPSRSTLPAPRAKPHQPVAQISIHTRATVEARVRLVRGAGEMGTLPSRTATQGTAQDCHRHQRNTSSCGDRWHMTLLMLAAASAAVSAVCSHTFINANLGDIYSQDVFQLWRTISCIHLTFPQRGSSQMTNVKSPSLIYSQNWLLCHFLPTSTSLCPVKGSSAW